MVKPAQTRATFVPIEDVERALNEDYCFASFSAIAAHGWRAQDIAAKLALAKRAVEEQARSSADAGVRSEPPKPTQSRAERLRELVKKAKE